MAHATDNPDRTEAARRLVQQAHAHVSTGAYREAHAAFSAAIEVLRDSLGPEHPEVQEAEEDRETVIEMAGVADFLTSAKLRMPGDLPEHPDPSKGGPSEP